MEHAVYVCSWSRSAAGFKLWVKARPQLDGAAPTYTEAETRLLEAIQNAGGAMQAVLEFDPPLPKSAWEEKYARPELYLICGDDRFETDAPRWKWSEEASQVEERRRLLDAFYSAPVCRKCKYTVGRRSDKPLSLTYAPRRLDGAFGSLATDGGPNHQIVSEAFLALLTPEERGGLEFQPTLRQRGRKFFELVGPEGPPPVAVAGLAASGWRCTACDHRTWGYWVPGMSISSFVARTDLSESLAGVFTVGTFPEIELAVTAPRWQELVGRPGTRGFTSRPLGVAADPEVVRQPELPTYEEQLAESRRKDPGN
jgi:hypothetical protein